MEKWVERTGALHVHSRYSDGSGTVQEILQAARTAGLDFVVLTDHDSLAAAREGWAGRHDGVVLAVAPEITPKRVGHYLAMNVRQCLGYARMDLRRALDGVRSQGGYALVAHPAGKRRLSLKINHAPWREWAHPAVRGLEIWSYMHDWVDGVVWWRFSSAYEFWKYPERRVRGPDPAVVRLWDRLGRTRRMVGLVGLDCHARAVPLTGVKVFPYERAFRLVRNHIFVRERDWETDPQAALWEALAQGRLFMAHDILADAEGARCEGVLPGGSTLQMGEEAPYRPGIVLRLRLPRPAEIRWFAEGRCRLMVHDRSLTARPAGPGVYRFEAWLDGRPWLFTNPFYLR